MENLLRNHKNNHNCRLGMPEGLKELMADISREVLRSQPDDVLGFIAHYLSALLITRENAFAAQMIIEDVCDCFPIRLSHHLLEIGLTEKQTQIVAAIVNKHFKCDMVKEEKLMKELIEHAEVKREQLSSICDVVREAYMQYKKLNITVEHLIEDPDVVNKAVHHTMNVYKKQNLDHDDFNQMAERIQLAYKSYRNRNNQANSSSNTTSSGTSVALEKSIRFENNMTELGLSPSYPETGTMRSHSSVTLAGSFIYYPNFRPYSTSEYTTPETIPEVDVDVSSRSFSEVPQSEIRVSTDVDVTMETLVEYKEGRDTLSNESATEENDLERDPLGQSSEFNQYDPDDSDTTSSSEVAITVHSMSVENINYNEENSVE